MTSNAVAAFAAMLASGESRTGRNPCPGAKKPFSRRFVHGGGAGTANPAAVRGAVFGQGGEGAQRMRGIDEGRAGVEADGHAERFEQFLAGGPRVHRPFGVQDDAGVTAGGRGHGQGDQFAGLGIERAMDGPGLVKGRDAVHDLGIAFGQCAEILHDIAKQCLPVRRHAVLLVFAACAAVAGNADPTAPGSIRAGPKSG